MRRRWTPRSEALRARRPRRAVRRPGPSGAVLVGSVAALAAVAARARTIRAHRLRARRHPRADLTLDDGVALATRAWGPQDGEPCVVLVHGFAERLAEFHHQIPPLADITRVVAYDQRGHGDSGWGGRRSANLDRLAHDLEHVLERRTSGPLVLVGHSMGGMVILALAQRRPDLVRDRVTGVALLSTSAGGLAASTIPPPVARALVRSGAARGLLVLDWLVAPLIERARPLQRSSIRDRLHRRMFGARRPDPQDTRLVDSTLSSTRRAVTASLLPSLAEHSRREAIGRLRGRPVLVLTGTDDRTIPPTHSRTIAEALPQDARLVEVAGGGHMTHLTHAGQVNRELIDLVRDATARRHATRGALDERDP